MPGHKKVVIFPPLYVCTTQKRVGEQAPAAELEYTLVGLKVMGI